MEERRYASVIREAQELGYDWTTFDGRLIHTRAAMAAFSAGDRREAEQLFAPRR